MSIRISRYSNELATAGVMLDWLCRKLRIPRGRASISWQQYRPYSRVWRVAVSSPRQHYYVKALPKRNLREIAFLKLTSEHRVQGVPELIASDDSLGLILLPALCQSTLRPDRTSILARYLAIQSSLYIATKFDGAKIREAFPQVTFRDALARIARHMTSDGTPVGCWTRMDSALIGPFVESLQKVSNAHERLQRTLDIVDSVYNHLDLHEGNVVSSPDGITILDWSDVVIGPPGLSLLSLLADPIDVIGGGVGLGADHPLLTQMEAALSGYGLEKHMLYPFIVAVLLLSACWHCLDFDHISTKSDGQERILSVIFNQNIRLFIACADSLQGT
jgi:hypothetical protein